MKKDLKVEKGKRLHEEAKNALTLADLVVNPSTTPSLQVRILNKLLEGRRNPDFFMTMFESKMSFGKCPCCEWEGHWLVPENALNEMGYVSADHDPRVKRETTAADCPSYQEACQKKRVTS